MQLIQKEKDIIKYNISITEHDCETLRKLCLNQIDHHVFKKDGEYHLILHGCSQGKVIYNNKWYTLKELEPIIQKELELSYTQDLIVNVYCCYGGYMKPFHNNNRRITSFFNCFSKLNMTITYGLSNFSCNFCVA